MRTLEDVNNPDMVPGKTVSIEKLEKELGSVIEEIRIVPMLDNVTRMLDVANCILKVADGSGNLKGGFVRALKKAALVIRHTATTMS